MYLTPKEIKAIKEVHLAGSQDGMRDRFILGCVTGLRFSDYSRLSADHIQGHLISILTKKRNRSVVIPMHEYVTQIFEKWNYNLPPDLSLRQYNNVLPIIAQKSGIRDEVVVEKKINGKVEMQKVPKFELVKTHTPRRSFATNAYQAGIPVRNIMLITGHKTEDSFFRYVQTTGLENAQDLIDHPFFKL